MKFSDVFASASKGKNMYEVASYDVIVIGAGHAGCEAGLAAARLGARTLLCTISLENIAMMPCNPAIGGPGKSQLVRELDALGGQMGIVADETAIQMRMLNRGKGPAVHALRAQNDKNAYHRRMKQIVENEPRLDVKQLMVTDLLVEDGRVTGIKTELDEAYRAKAVVLATGTYLQGEILIGTHKYSGGPNGYRASLKLADSLREHGVELRRFKTGTPSRVDLRTLSLERMERQDGDRDFHTFSFLSERKDRNATCCWLTYTNAETHAIIRANLDRAPLYAGLVHGVGARYCPSIEDKVVRFADKERHQLFIEPEGLETNEMYVQGMSTSLPMDVQYAFLRTIPGLEHVEIMRPAYAIEYECLDPLQLTAGLRYKKCDGLFSAGQANGTSGYEEAAAQGFIAGINAAHYVLGKEPFTLTRAQAYIGTLIDDLVTKGTNEPYRMMTSRSEYRLLLRQDNADLRLTPLGRTLGLVSDERWARYEAKRAAVEEGHRKLNETMLTPTAETNAYLTSLGSAALKTGTTAAQLLRRPEISYRDIAHLLGWDDPGIDVREELSVSTKYEGYITKQEERIRRQQKMETTQLADDLPYDTLRGISIEARQKLQQIKPATLGQASRVSGVSPADITVLMIYLEQQRRQGVNYDA